MQKLTNEQAQVISAIYKKRHMVVKLLSYFSFPFGLGAIYVIVKLLSEGIHEQLGIGIYLGFGFLALSIAAPIYLWLSFVKIKMESKNLPTFEIKMAEGLPKLKEAIYKQPFKVPLHPPTTLLILTRRRRFTAEIDGVTYNLWAINPAVIGSNPVRFIAISRRSWLIGCNWKNFVIDVQELSPEDIKKYEERALTTWPEDKFKEDLIQNRLGLLSAGQIKRLRLAKIKDVLLWIVLSVAGAFMLSLSGYLFLSSENMSGKNILGAVFIGGLGLFLFAVSLYFLITTLFAKGLTKLDVMSFVGQVEKRRGAIYSEHRQNSDLDMFPIVAFDRRRYLLSPDDLFYKIPQTAEMKYYYVVNNKAKTIINFERP